MKSLENQLRRLLRAASMAQQQTDSDLGTAPDARWLLRQRQQELACIPITIRLVLQGGLALACLLLLATFLVSARQIEQTNADVFAVSEAVLTRLSTP